MTIQIRTSTTEYECHDGVCEAVSHAAYICKGGVCEMVSSSAAAGAPIALVVLGIFTYAVVAGVAWALYERHLGEAGDLTWFLVGILWPVYLALGVCALPMLLGRWVARPRPKRDVNAELARLEAEVEEILGNQSRNA